MGFGSLVVSTDSPCGMETGIQSHVPGLNPVLHPREPDNTLSPVFDDLNPEALICQTTAQVWFAAATSVPTRPLLLLKKGEGEGISSGH